MRHKRTAFSSAILHGFLRGADDPAFDHMNVLINYFLLGFFEDHHFIRVTHTLALVWLGRTIGANFSGDLTHLLLVGPFDTISVWVGVSTLIPAGIL